MATKKTAKTPKINESVNDKVLYIKEPRKKAMIAFPKDAQNIHHYLGLCDTKPLTTDPAIAIIKGKDTTISNFLDTTHDFYEATMTPKQIKESFGNKVLITGKDTNYTVVNGVFWDHFKDEYTAFKGDKELEYNHTKMTDSLGNVLEGDMKARTFKLELTHKTEKVDKDMFDALSIPSKWRDGFEGWTDKKFVLVGFEYKDFNKENYDAYANETVTKDVKATKATKVTKPRKIKAAKTVEAKSPELDMGDLELPENQL